MGIILSLWVWGHFLHNRKLIHHFADKGLYSQSYGFPSSHVRMWELDHEEGWMPNNRCFQAVVLEKTLMSPWTARSSNQSILKEISPEYSLEGLMLKLKLQYFGHLMRRVDSLEKTLMLLNCSVGEDSWESLGLQGDPTSPFWRRSALGFLWKDWC